MRPMSPSEYMMSLAKYLNALAMRTEAAELSRQAMMVRKMECTLDEITAEAMEDAAPPRRRFVPRVVGGMS